MDSAKPTQDLVRALTDEHVLRALMQHRRLTRAELAVEIGISKPTAGESVRRLTERGLVADTGQRTPGGRGRGRVGSYYALDPSVGTALAVTIAPEGVVAESLDVYGDTVAREARGADPSRVPETLAEVVAATGQAATGHKARLAVVGAADPVDRATGRLVQLPDAPFLVGALDPVAVLAPHVDGPGIVDNDVNWAAQGEAVRDGGRGDIAYRYK
ncbi:winged helix-turn-helix transcriptional regulator, partial [Actinoplanes sp. NPDC051633]|uniref:ROK family transcriptional regulator n=1 Tax=Actinoplanes sp. NPDC051633 TaxID=3155670 RepID=UPI003411F9DE